MPFPHPPFGHLLPVGEGKRCLLRSRSLPTLRASQVPCAESSAQGETGSRCVVFAIASIALFDKAGAAPATVSNAALEWARFDLTPLCTAREGDRTGRVFARRLQARRPACVGIALRSHSLRRCGGQRTGVSRVVRTPLLLSETSRAASQRVCFRSMKCRKNPFFSSPSVLRLAALFFFLHSTRVRNPISRVYR